MNPQEPLVISTPNPSYIALGTQLVRILLYVATGVGFTIDIADSEITQAVSAVVFLGTLGWSLWRTFAAARREDTIAQVNNNSMPGGPAMQPAKVPV